jgi:ubiquitin-like protein Pup
MAEQVKTRVRPPEKREEETHDEVVQNRLAGKGESIKKRLDGVLDEIDDLLEENAEEFVASYVQHGGE